MALWATLPVETRSWREDRSSLRAQCAHGPANSVQASDAKDESNTDPKEALFLVEAPIALTTKRTLARGDVVRGRRSGPSVALDGDGLAPASSLRRLPDDVAAALEADAAMCGADVATSLREAAELAGRLDRGQAARSAAALDDWRSRRRRGDATASDADHAGVLDSLGLKTMDGRTFELASALLALRQFQAASQDELAKRGGDAAAVRTQSFQMATNMLLCEPGRQLAEDDGADPAPYLSRAPVPRSALAPLFEEGYVVVDGALPPREARALRGELEALHAAGGLASEESNFQKLAGTRGDAAGWVSRDSPRRAVARAVEALYGVAALLGPGLRVPAAIMAARYPGEGEPAPYRGARRRRRDPAYARRRFAPRRLQNPPGQRGPRRRDVLVDPRVHGDPLLQRPGVARRAGRPPRHLPGPARERRQAERRRRGRRAARRPPRRLRQLPLARGPAGDGAAVRAHELDHARGPGVRRGRS